LGGLIVAPARIAWRLAAVTDVLVETPRAKTLVLDVPGWPGHVAGQHVDVRLTAEDGYQYYTRRSVCREEKVRTISGGTWPLRPGHVP
jgi:ferredoxin-NADP reductase